MSGLKKMILGILIMAVGGALLTVGGYLAKDGWEELKKQPPESDKTYKSQDSTLDEIYALLKWDIERRSTSASTKAILSYVRAIANDSTSLANIWSKILDDLEHGTAFKEESYLHELEIKYGYRKEPNAPYFYRLERFYDLLNKVPHSSLNSTWIHSLSESLDKLTNARPEMLKAMRLIAVGKGDDKKVEELNRLSESVVLLHQEAAKINSLVHELELYTEKKDPAEQ